MAHLHVTSWLITFILLFIVSSFYKQGKEKPAKILHMINRLIFLIILYSGGSLMSIYMRSDAGLTGEVIIKVIAGIWAIVAIEMISVKTKNNKPTKSWWIQFVVAALIAIILGFTRLPLGVLP